MKKIINMSAKELEKALDGLFDKINDNPHVGDIQIIMGICSQFKHPSLNLVEYTKDKMLASSDEVRLLFVMTPLITENDFEYVNTIKPKDIKIFSGLDLENIKSSYYFKLYMEICISILSFEDELTTFDKRLIDVVPPRCSNYIYHTLTNYVEDELTIHSTPINEYGFAHKFWDVHKHIIKRTDYKQRQMKINFEEPNKKVGVKFSYADYESIIKLHLDHTDRISKYYSEDLVELMFYNTLADDYDDATCGYNTIAQYIVMFYREKVEAIDAILTKLEKSLVGQYNMNESYMDHAKSIIKILEIETECDERNYNNELVVYKNMFSLITHKVIRENIIFALNTNRKEFKDNLKVLIVSTIAFILNNPSMMGYVCVGGGINAFSEICRNTEFN